MAGRAFSNRGSFRGRGSVRRQTDWGISIKTSATVPIAAATKVLVISIPAVALGLVGPGTIVRTRGYVSVGTDQLGGSEDQIGAFGFAFVNEQARAAGAASIPGPFTNQNFEGWFVHGAFGQSYFVQTAVGFNANIAQRYEVDSKAMRKYDEDLGLVFMVENGHATNGFNILANFRFLIKRT